MLRYLTAGESHGKCLIAIIEGMPANMSIDINKINELLAKRQQGYGRGGRMKIEEDKVEILSGVRGGKTLGSPICIKIENKDWENWSKIMDSVSGSGGEVTRPRPGHADLAGALKYNQTDIRNIFERSSARETAIRAAVGAVAMQLLEKLGIKIYSHVIQIGTIKIEKKFETYGDFTKIVENSRLRCCDPAAEEKMIELIDSAKEKGDSLGGVFEIIAAGVPVGLGSCMHWDRKLDARLAFSLMSIQAIKGVEIGGGFDMASKFGSEVHDEIFYEAGNYYRKTNNSGGIEGGMSNGENIVIRAAMKPIPTLYKPLKSVNINTKEPVEAGVERSDICAVPAASIVGQSAAAWELACAFVEKFGGDSIEEVRENFERFEQMFM